MYLSERCVCTHIDGECEWIYTCKGDHVCVHVSVCVRRHVHECVCECTCMCVSVLHVCTCDGSHLWEHQSAAPVWSKGALRPSDVPTPCR